MIEVMLEHDGVEYDIGEMYYSEAVQYYNLLREHGVFLQGEEIQRLWPTSSEMHVYPNELGVVEGEEFVISLSCIKP